MLDRLATILQQNCNLDLNIKLLIGVSGGPDSLCLLDICDTLGVPLVVAHLNHGLRPEAAAEAGYVEHLAAERNAVFVSETVDVPAYAAEHQLSIEEAARNARYLFLFAQAARYQAQAVAVAHHADDQVETVLMHLLSGAGLQGLKGMPFRSLPNAWSSSIPLVRPLLGIWREEILEYCRSRRLDPVYDSSNLDQNYFRNRLRHDLIPYLEKYQPHIRKTLWRSAQVVGGEDEMIEQITHQAWQAVGAKVSPGAVCFERSPFNRQPEAIRRRLLRMALAELHADLREVGFDDIERALQFFQQPTRSGLRDLAAGLMLRVEGEFLWLASWDAGLSGLETPQVLPGCSLALLVPGIISLESGWQMEARQIKVDETQLVKALSNSNPYQAWVDAHSLSSPLTIRSRLAGDRFQPVGMQGHTVKLSDFLINVKMPARARAAWPLVCSGEQIVWVPGYRLAHPFRLQPDSKEAVYLQLIQKSENE